MKKPVQILLILALFPMVGTAREETLEERKQRIVRKYLRERASVTQSDMVVPSDLPEDERITDSEKFKDAEISLEREEAGAKPYMPPPPQQPPVQQRQHSNWLLDDSTETQTGLGMFGNTAADPTIDNGDSLWSSWGGDATDDRYSSRSDSIERRSNPTPRDQGYANGSRVRQDQRGFSTSRTTDIFGRTASDTQQDYTTGFGLQDRQQRTFGSSPDQGLLTTTPFRQLDSYDAENEQRRSDSSSGYQPYKSPYEQQRESREQQRQQQSNPYGSQQDTKPEYQRPNQYQQFKDRNKSYDPLADDAYLKQNKR